jgi:hypothetical protein
MFLNTLEFYGTSMPSWVREQQLLPRIREVSAGELGRILEATGVPYVVLNPPPPGEKAKTFELWHAGSFLVRAQGSKPGIRRRRMNGHERAKVLVAELDRILEGFPGRWCQDGVKKAGNKGDRFGNSLSTARKIGQK